MVALSLVFSAFLLTSHAHAQIVQDGGTDLAFRVPVSVNWWTVLDENWHDSISGIAGFRTGLELYPVGEGKTPEDGVLRLYGRVLLNWRIGAGGQETYKALYNEFGIQPQLLVRLNITRQHSVCLGAGPLWALEMYTFSPKYDDKKTSTRRGTAVAISAGYGFKTKGCLSFFAEFEYDHFITNGLLDVFTPSVGITVAL